MSTILRRVDFGYIWGASGVQGFFGEGYRFHRYLKPLGLDFKGVTFVAKTTTYDPRKGNMPLGWDFTPAEFRPKCIVVKHRKGVALNAVGLSGPGALALLRDGRWQDHTKPFFISFMSVAATPAERAMELRKFTVLMKTRLRQFRAPVGLQINYSCPNVGLHFDELLLEVKEGHDIVTGLGIPILDKFNVLLPVGLAVEMADHPTCDGIVVSNAIPFGALPENIDWAGLFGPGPSPLANLGGGALSGAPLLRLVTEWIQKVRRAGFRKHVNGGGGILSAHDGRSVLDAGADSIFVGSAAFLRPWRLSGIVRDISAYIPREAARRLGCSDPERWYAVPDENASNRETLKFLKHADTCPYHGEKEDRENRGLAYLVKKVL